ncbi:MAG: hypothetical protein COB23_10180 [Methylophaga sp.]|nr:MAG: hypothetical protein COB23_10180 [Methylophaga sp.]
MLGLLFLVIFAVYLLVSFGVIHFGIKQARKRGFKGWLGGLLAAFVMYSLVFWDLIPVYLIHDYQCENNAGFTVYKTLDEWKQENLGVAEILIPIENSSPKKMGKTTRYQLNQRFAWDITYSKIWHIVRKVDERIIDIETGYVLVQYIDFSASVSGLYNANKLSDYKLWFEAGSCEQANSLRTRPQKYRFNKLKSWIKYQYHKGI